MKKIKTEETNIICRGGISLGTLIAVIASYLAGNHLGWIILHGTLGWLYVIYYIFKYGLTI